MLANDTLISGTCYLTDVQRPKRGLQALGLEVPPHSPTIGSKVEVERRRKKRKRTGEQRTEEQRERGRGRG